METYIIILVNNIIKWRVCNKVLLTISTTQSIATVSYTHLLCLSFNCNKVSRNHLLDRVLVMFRHTDINNQLEIPTAGAAPELATK